MRLCVLFLFVPVLLVTSGCASIIEEASLEDLGMVGVIGFDYVDDETTKITVAYPQPSEKAKEKTVVLSSESNMVHAPILELSARSQKTLVLDQLRVVLFSEELAREKGIGEIVKHLYRDPMVGDAVLLGIVKGSTEDLLNRDYPQRPQISNYLNNLLRPTEATAFSPFTTIHDFIYDLTNGVTSPLVPYLDMVEGSFDINAISVFKGEKMIGAITPEEAKLVQGLQNVVQIPSFLLKVESGTTNNDEPELLLIDFVKTEFKVSSNGGLEAPIINLDLKVKGSVLEYKGKLNFESDSDRKIAAEAVNKEIKKQTKKLIDKLNEMEVDPIGLRKPLRRQYRGEWSGEKGLRALKNADYNINVSTEIISSGTRK